jgi:hypothetical protein
VVKDIKKKVERFNRKFKSKGGIAQFKKMVERLDTLQKIGNHFGFSRQNAWQLYNELYQEPFGTIREKRTFLNMERRTNTLEGKLELYHKGGSAWRRVFYTEVVKTEAIKRGLEVKLIGNTSSYVALLIEGHKAIVSGTKTKRVYYNTKGRDPQIYFRFHVSPRECDFYVFVLDMKKGAYLFYIIPQEKIKGLRGVNLKANYEVNLPPGFSGKLPYNLGKSKYRAHLGGWDAFKTPK